MPSGSVHSRRSHRCPLAAKDRLQGVRCPRRRLRRSRGGADRRPATLNGSAADCGSCGAAVGRRWPTPANDPSPKAHLHPLSARRGRSRRCRRTAASTGSEETNHLWREEQQHDRAMHRERLVVELVLDDLLSWERELGPYQQRENSADHNGFRPGTPTRLSASTVAMQLRISSRAARSMSWLVLWGAAAIAVGRSGMCSRWGA
jgi:hypothetical protein